MRTIKSCLVTPKTRYLSQTQTVKHIAKTTLSIKYQLLCISRTPMNQFSFYNFNCGIDQHAAKRMHDKLKRIYVFGWKRCSHHLWRKRLLGLCRQHIRRHASVYVIAWVEHTLKADNTMEKWMNVVWCAHKIIDCHAWRRQFMTAVAIDKVLHPIRARLCDRLASVIHTLYSSL